MHRSSIRLHLPFGERQGNVMSQFRLGETHRPSEAIVCSLHGTSRLRARMCGYVDTSLDSHSTYPMACVQDDLLESQDRQS